ncbi:MAG TPA: hypothetical protein VFL56_07565 [Solirubrobacterales bacterium]|nr:hypothetical protein [Solirubrobacterales bacterium]HEU4980286.1 hypothetical protein [Solirubrobacterales bacterium]
MRPEGVGHGAVREVELRASPRPVFRVRGGKIDFVEGNGDRRRAFTDVGLDPE